MGTVRSLYSLLPLIVIKNPIDTYCLSTDSGTQKTSLTKQEDKTVLVRDALQEKGNMGKNEDKD